ncbi:MAG: TIGR03560 family F420-dependent LLM class oxidoreductase [Candidatus Limnocylindrales bacterium]
MRFTLMVDPQEGLSYAAMLELALAAEAAGFEGFVRSDHWLSLEGEWSRPASDAWTTLAGLARDTRRIRLGTMVSPVTFRHPVALAKIVATVDEMSGGRVELGLGAGWYGPEHERFGLANPPRAERFEWLEEQLQIVRGLWTQPSFNFTGHHYQLHEAVCEPKPVQHPHPPIVVGGYGKPKLVRLAATHADELNLDSPPPEACREVFARLDDACRAVGRHPGGVTRSAMLMWTAADAALPAAEQQDRMVQYRDAGVQRVVLNVWPGPGDAAMIERFGREVIAGLA